jgi:hypothetical protein
MIGGAVGGLLNALELFFDQLGAIHWMPIGVAVLCHFAKVLVRTRAWRNILGAAYPEAAVRWRDVLGAYVAGTGVNAVLPARGGDALKLFLVHRRIEGSSYPTLAATLLVETFFDAVIATALLLWAIQQGVLPGLGVLPTLSSIDWLWLFQNPRAGAVAVAALLGLGLALGMLVARRIDRFRQRLARGFAILSPPRRYLRHVVPWQAMSWIFRLLSVVFFLDAFRIETSATNALRVQVSESLATAVPLTPSGIGTQQALVVYVLRGEAPLSALLSFSVGMKLVLIAANIVAAALVIGVTLRTLRWRRIVERARVRLDAGRLEGRGSAHPQEPAVAHGSGVPARQTREAGRSRRGFRIGHPATRTRSGAARPLPVARVSDTVAEPVPGTDRRSEG